MKNTSASILAILFLALLITACGSANRDAANSPEYREMVEKVNDLHFEIENQWANPLRYDRMNLLGNPNHIKFKGDSVDVFLPFFGVRHSGGGYGSDGAVIYEGVMENLRVEESPRKGEMRVFFEGNRKTENMDFQITIYPNGKTTTYFGSSQRDRIIYDGEIKE